MIVYWSIYRELFGQPFSLPWKVWAAIFPIKYTGNSAYFLWLIMAWILFFSLYILSLFSLWCQEQIIKKWNKQLIHQELVCSNDCCFSHIMWIMALKMNVLVLPNFTSSLDQTAIRSPLAYPVGLQLTTLWWSLFYSRSYSNLNLSFVCIYVSTLSELLSCNLKALFFFLLPVSSHFHGI